MKIRETVNRIRMQATDTKLMQKVDKAARWEELAALELDFRGGRGHCMVRTWPLTLALPGTLTARN